MRSCSARLILDQTSLSGGRPLLQESSAFTAWADEQSGYLEVAGHHLYSVLHPALESRARVLVVGAFASERSSTYLPLVRWARYLALHHITALRFDYRGVGESTGVFRDMCLSSWQEDTECLSSWFDLQDSSTPLILHGLGLGAILAAKAFERGFGDGLLLWSPPSTAHAMLRSVLKNWWLVENLKTSPELRKPLAHYIRLLQEGRSVEVNGYEWTPELWQESLDYALPAWTAQTDFSTGDDVRPVKVIPLGRDAVPLVRGGIAGYEESNDLERLYEQTFRWIASAFPNGWSARP